MDMRKTGILSAAIGAVLGMAALGCSGKTHYHVPVIFAVTPPQAKVGTSVVITGANFKSLQTVNFGGIPAINYHMDSDTQITATVPDNAITYAIEITNAAGVADSPTSFIVMPVVSGYTLVSDPAAPPPAVIRLAGSGFYDTSAVTIGGVGLTGGVNFTYNDQNTLTVTVPSGVTGQVVVSASGIASTDAVTYP
jgi:hypothetical protein